MCSADMTHGATIRADTVLPLPAMPLRSDLSEESDPLALNLFRESAHVGAS